MTQESNELIAIAPAQPVTEQTNNLITLRLVATFAPEQEDKVREILNQNYFMRIVRQLKAIDVDVDFSRVAADEAV